MAIWFWIGFSSAVIVAPQAWRRVLVELRSLRSAP
jgi:hypothetical protein